MRFVILFVFYFYSNNILFSQNQFYDVDSIRDIRINFYDANWDYLLDSLYVVGQKERILADIEIDGHNYDSVGVRYKGFSSVSVNRVKNPFNIKLDYIIDDQDHKGVEKLKLSNIIQDPSFIREVLTYEICRKYMPASMANYANLYINDTLWGLYTNVEAVNKDFLNDHFGSKYNPFFKCNPENLNIQIGGENSNLSNTHGVDSSDYYTYYDIESDYGWADLYNLIDTLNNFKDSVHYLLNIDRTLWMHALNYSLVNFDSYIGYAQNFYLYRDQARQFSPIIWDLNMSFGGFRLTDASQLYFSGFDINQAQNMDPLIHYNFISVSPRPLMRNLFDNERYRKMYLAHIRTIMEENFVNQDYFYRGQYFQSIIDQHVQNDTNKFYSYTDFITNLNNQVSLVASICPGITQLMDSRSSYLSSYKGYLGHPVINNVTYHPQNLSLGDDLWITASITDATYAMVSYRFGNNQRFRSLEMFDDGNHNDGASGDGIYGCKIINSSNNIDYFLYAENDSAGIFSPERAAYEYYNITAKISSGDLVINELMSNNKTVVSDASGKFEDWIELYNTTNTPISTQGLFLSDTILNLFKWDLPNHIISANDYLIIWADEDGNQGQEHANFQLSNLGETLLLSHYDSSLIDSITYVSQNIDVSFGRNPNGFGAFTMLTPTFSANNDYTIANNFTDIDFLDVYPNPFINEIFIYSNSPYFITDVTGKIVLENNNLDILNTSDWNSGVYFIHLNNNTRQVIKIIKI
tara:strand:+ start:12966 stop:15215 length:2250 start_codon:yes stop_codon:yes gene_type:complete